MIYTIKPQISFGINQIYCYKDEYSYKLSTSEDEKYSHVSRACMIFSAQDYANFELIIMPNFTNTKHDPYNRESLDFLQWMWENVGATKNWMVKHPIRYSKVAVNEYAVLIYIDKSLQTEISYFKMKWC